MAVFSGATCNARVTSGCGQAPAHIGVGPGPFGIFADDANHTVYVGNAGPTASNDTMSMINTLTCNGSDLAGCAKQKPPAVPVGVGLDDFDVDQATHTMYVGFGNGAAGVAAFDARTCNAGALSGCGHIGRLSYPQAPFVPAVSVDSSNNTIYAAGATNTIAAFDGRKCNADDLAGCASDKPGTVTVAPPAFFEVAWWLVVDAPLHTVYVVNQKDDTLSAVSTDACNGRRLARCAQLRPPTIHTGEDPESVALNPGTQTLYTANQVTNDVSVIDASRCNAAITSGCRQPPPAITLPGPGALTADPAVSTLYIATGTNTVSMINSRTCNAYRRDGCTPTPPAVTVGAFPAGIAVNQQTHTIYVANSGSGKTGSVSVLDDQTCNATTTTGCKNARTLQVPDGNAQAIAVNPATDTIYVTTIPPSGPSGPSAPSTVSVFNGATCNAADTTGCGQAPHSVKVGFDATALAINVLTDTIYVANFAQKNSPFGGNAVSVIDGTTCNATTTTGCAKAPKTIILGPAFTTPAGVAIDQVTDTIYVADLQNGEGSGTVSVINGAICNATITTGCGQTPPTVTSRLRPSRDRLQPRQPDRRRDQHRRHQRLGHRRSDLQRRHQLQLQPHPAKVPGRPRAGGGRGEPSCGDGLRLQRRWHRLDHPSGSVKHPPTQPCAMNRTLAPADEYSDPRLAKLSTRPPEHRFRLLPGPPCRLWITAMRPRRGPPPLVTCWKPPSAAVTPPRTPACSSTADSQSPARINRSPPDQDQERP